MARIADPTLRTNILQAARAVFKHKGYADARMSDIAATAGVAVGTIYLHFRTKEGLVVALADELNGRILHEALPKLAAGDLATAIAEALRTALAICRAERDLLTMVHLQVGLAAFVEPSASDEAITATLTEMLAERMARGEARPYDPEKLAQIIINFVDRAALLSFIEGDESAQRFEETLIRFVQHAVVRPENA